MADQWRGNAIGYLNIEPVKTPNLDKLASAGVHFTDAVSCYPVSSPARAMLMTGLYPVSNKVTGNCNSANTPHGVELETDVRCWSDVLKEKGYATGYLGKWHLDAPVAPYVNTSNNKGKVAWNEWCPSNRRHGFDLWTAYGTYDDHLKPMYWDTHSSRDSFYYVSEWGPTFEANRAIEYIKNEDGRFRNPEKPFALVVSMNPPHTGYELVPEKYKAVYQHVNVDSLAIPESLLAGDKKFVEFYKANVLNYYACMTGVDDQIGRIIESLKGEGVVDNTIVVFTSDHGDAMGMHETIGKNTMYEESMRIPMIISWPDKLKPRKDENLMIGFSDLGPTLLSMMGFEKDIPEGTQTYNLASGVLSADNELEVVQPYYFIVSSDLSSGRRGLRNKCYTFAIRAEKGVCKEYFLFDRQTDPWQLNNVASKNPELVKKLTSQLKAHLQRTNDPFANYIN